jgi:hypothetical protein
MDKNHL